MKKNIKLILLCLFISFMTGCTAEDRIIIKKDSRIEEYIKFIENNETILSYAPDVDTYLSTTIVQVNKAGLIDQNYLKNIKGKTSSGESSTVVYNDFASFQQGTPLKGKVFDSLTQDVHGDIVDIKFNSISRPYDVLVSNSEDNPLLDKFTISIKLPYEVINSNADHVDKINNIYYWYYNKLTLYKDVDISYNNSRIYHPSLFDRITDAFHRGNLTAVILMASIMTIALVAIVFVRIKKLDISNV